MLNIGLDVSKETIDFAIPKKNKGFKSGKISNDLNGFAHLEKQLLSLHIKCKLICETTGIYSFPIMDYFSERGWHCNEVHAFLISSYKKTVLQRNKTDKVDAREISNYAERYADKLQKPYVSRTYQLIELGLLIRMQEQLIKRKKGLNGIMEAYGFLTDSRVEGFNFEMAGKGLTSLLESTEKFNKNFKKGIVNYAKEHFKDTYKNLESIVGLGDSTIPLLIYHTNDFTRFNSVRDFTSYCGLVPNFYESGTSVSKKSKIANKQQCNNDLRTALTQAGNVAMRHNRQVKNLVNRLSHLKWKQQLIAATRKLAVQAYYCGKNKEVYNPQKA